MALLNTLKQRLSGIWQGTKTLMETPLIGAGGIVDSTPPIIRAITTLSDNERLRQKDVLAARVFHEGKNSVRLTDRLKEFLGSDEDIVSLSININSIVNMAVAERLEVEGWDCDDTNQIDFAQMVWDGSRMKSKQSDVFEETVVDGEHFILISWDAENNRPKLTPHPRYTDTTVAAEELVGTGDGIRMHYQNDDVSDKPLFASKRWTECWIDESGRTKSEKRVNVYFPGEIRKYHYTPLGWAPLIEYVMGEDGMPTEQELPWPLPWVGKQGNPLGIPVVHLKQPRLRPESKRAWGAQKAISKTMLDLLTASDMTAFRILVTYGWEMKNANGDPLQFSPGVNIGTMKTDGRHEVVEGANLQDIRDTIDKLILWTAGVTDTPASRFVMSGAVRAEGTMQEEKEALLAKVERRANGFEMALEDAMKIARRLHNTFSVGGEFGELNEEPEFKVKWKEFYTRSTEEKLSETNAMLAAGISEELVQRKVWNLSEDEIKENSANLRGYSMANLNTNGQPQTETQPVAA